jgi:hypothetical protein
MKQVVFVVKVGKVGVYFNHPIGDAEDHCSNIEHRDLSSQKWFIFHPRNYVVHDP